MFNNNARLLRYGNAEKLQSDWSLQDLGGVYNSMYAKLPDPLSCVRRLKGVASETFYGESFGGRGFVTILHTIVLQAPLDRAYRELPSATRTLISHWEKFHGKTGKIWRSIIATIRCIPAFSI